MIFTIPGEPRGKDRPRYSRKSGTVYTPSETVQYEKKVKACYAAEGGGPLPPKHEVRKEDGTPELVPQPYKVEIWAFLEPPMSETKTRRELMLRNAIQPTKKPDVDNIGKIILDALNGSAFQDDKAVTELTVHKRYSLFPRVVVEVTTV